MRHLLLIFALPSVVLAVSENETLLFNRARTIATAPVEDFSVLGGTQDARDGGYRYQLAFLGYGVCSVVTGDSSLKAEGSKIFTRLVEKMEHPTTLAYWTALGYGGDGVGTKNVMYRGHLNLMYGLAHDRFGEQRFDEKFHELSRKLFDEITGKHPICCEPDQLFIQCNAVTVLSLFLHDRAFGTHYAESGKKLLAWARENMPLKGTCLVQEDYHPSTGQSSAERAGYANAWTIAFLAPVPGLADEAAKMYKDWKKIYAETSLESGRVEGPRSEKAKSYEATVSSTMLATTFGLLAAREEGDEELHDKLAKTVGGMDGLVGMFGEKLPPARRAQARTFHTIAMFATTFRGWSEVLDLKSKSPTPKQVP